MRRAPTSTFRRIAAACLGLAAVTFAPTSGLAADSLATPMTGQSARELWPLDVTVEIVDVTPTRGAKQGRMPRVLAPQSVTVRDGHRLEYSAVLLTPSGRHRVDLAVVPHHHPEAVEIEWDLEVAEAPYQTVGVGDYLLHRLGVGPSLQLDDEALVVARADIETTENGQLRRRVRVGEQVYEIRIHAAVSRG
jgi:hypothetical protein